MIVRHFKPDDKEAFVKMLKEAEESGLELWVREDGVRIFEALDADGTPNGMLGVCLQEKKHAD